MVRHHPSTGRSETRLARDTVVRRRFACRGTVQGVGFRPAVYRLAASLNLTGLVRNDPDGATIEVEGRRNDVTTFQDRLQASLPPLAHLADLRTTELPPMFSRTFVVAPSEAAPRQTAMIPPDAALCDECRSDMDRPPDRRHRYAFTTCTSCGPRFSIATALPYDRARTSMARFPLCKACAAEYTDVRSRRFHAEPICCPVCGPALWLADARGQVIAHHADALKSAREALAAGRIVAVKGIGGFQLACRADDRHAVKRLRDRKLRPTKPLAVMVRDRTVARAVAHLTDADADLMHSPRSPIVLAPRRTTAPIAAAIAPGIDDVGLMLPTTPLHIELFRDAPYDALIMTSGNATDEPIARDNDDARARLRGIADRFLLHDRDIVRRIDDSVVRSTPRGHVVLRRARGYVPEPVLLPQPTPQPVLAVGGHLQNTACLAVGGEAFLTQHIGDLDTESARRFLEEVIAGMESFLEIQSSLIAADLHPDYPSTWLADRLAAERNGRVIGVQHHLAHAFAVLGEHASVPTPGKRAGAIILDGTGYGLDQTSWGGEWLIIDGDLNWRRAAACTPVPLIGGERAVRAPWRMAASALGALPGDRVRLLTQMPLAEHVPPDELLKMATLSRSGRWPLTSGAGRLFEAAGAMLGLCPVNRWEGEAAARLEALAAEATGRAEPWPEVTLPAARNELPGPRLIEALARRVLAHVPPAEIAAGFHVTFADLAARLAARVFNRHVRDVALGGGCMVNRLLIVHLTDRLLAHGFTPLVPRHVPPGDGGLAYGQAVCAATACARNAAPRFAGAA